LIDFLLKYLRSWEEAVWMLRSPSVLAPFIIFAALQFLVLVCLALFYVSPLSTVMVPVVERLGGDEALHYPSHLVLLPRMYNLVYLPVAALVGFALFGWAVSLMVDYYERSGVEVERLHRRPLVSLIPALAVLGVVFVLSITVVQLVTSRVSAVAPHPMAARLVSLGGWAVVILIQALIIYSVFFLVTSTANPLRAVARSVRFSRRRLPLTAMLVLTVFLIHLPVDYLVQRVDRVVMKFDPLLIVGLLTAGIVLEIGTNFYLFAGTTSIVTGGRKVQLG
jgi:hypothetical protein